MFLNKLSRTIYNMKYQIVSITGILLLMLTITTTTVYSQDQDVINVNQSTTTNSFILNLAEEPFLVFEEGSGNETTISNDGEFDSYDGWYQDSIMINGFEATDTGIYTGMDQAEEKTFYSGNGKITLNNNETEIATYVYQGIEIPQKNDVGYKELGIQIFSTNSTGELSFLDNLVGIYEYDYSDSGETESGFIWKWK